MVSRTGGAQYPLQAHSMCRKPRCKYKSHHDICISGATYSNTSLVFNVLLLFDDFRLGIASSNTDPLNVNNCSEKREYLCNFKHSTQNIYSAITYTIKNPMEQTFKQQ